VEVSFIGGGNQPEYPVKTTGLQKFTTEQEE
jgi:hypothetical protein